jgi:muconate cycloisomerase
MGLLSALGGPLDRVEAEVLYLEGSLTRFFLERDLIADDLTFGPGGRAPALAGPGLGVRVKPEVLAGSECFTLS